MVRYNSERHVSACQLCQSDALWAYSKFPLKQHMLVLPELPKRKLLILAAD